MEVVKDRGVVVVTVGRNRKEDQPWGNQDKKTGKGYGN